MARSPSGPKLKVGRAGTAAGAACGASTAKHSASAASSRAPARPAMRQARAEARLSGGESARSGDAARLGARRKQEPRGAADSDGEAGLRGHAALTRRMRRAQEGLPASGFRLPASGFRLNYTIRGVDATRQEQSGHLTFLPCSNPLYENGEGKTSI